MVNDSFGVPVVAEKPNAYSYVRFSSAEQLKGHGLKRQVEKSEAFALKHGLNLVKSYRDLGVSAYRGRNRHAGAFGDFLALLQAGRIKRGSWLLVESLDRLSRDSVGAALPDFIDLLKAGIIVATVQDERIYDHRSIDDPIQLIGSLLVMARANEESKTKQYRSTENWKNKWAKGERLAICPAWLKLSADGSHYDRIKKRVSVVNEIFNLAATGLGSVTICRLLNERGVPPFGSDVKGKARTGKVGRGWHLSRVFSILQDRAVLGEYQPMLRDETGKPQPYGDPIRDHYPQIIEEALWHRVQSIKRKQVARKKGKGFANLFSGFAHCASCSGAMKVVWGLRGRRYYVCAQADKRLGCDDRTYWDYKLVEDAILDNVPEYKLSELFRVPEVDDHLQATESEIIRTSERLVDLDKRRQRALDLITESEPGDPIVGDLKARLNDLRHEAEGHKGALVQLRAMQSDLMAQRDQRLDAEGEVQRLRAALEGDLSENERLVIRQKLHTALKTFIFQVRFKGSERTFDVILIGNLRAYRFEDNGLRGVDRRVLARTYIVLDEVYRSEYPHVFGSLGTLRPGDEAAFETLLSTGPKREDRNPIRIEFIERDWPA